MYYLKQPATFQHVINKSRFIGFLYRCQSEEEAKEILQQLRKQHPKARHVCHGLIIDQLHRSNDDNEPASTAGLPILQTMLGYHVNETLGVVIRYFGGILLGKGGLIRAYSSTIAHTIEQAIWYEKVEYQKFKISIDFNYLSFIENHTDLEIINRFFDNRAHFEVFVLKQHNIQELLKEIVHHCDLIFLGTSEKLQASPTIQAK